MHLRSYLFCEYLFWLDPWLRCRHRIVAASTTGDPSDFVTAELVCFPDDRD